VRALVVVLVVGVVAARVGPVVRIVPVWK